MALRCLLFSSDEGTAEPILQVLAGLNVEGELCSEAVAAVEKVSHQNFQIVIIDWDKQPEAALLLTSARERKASERPLTLAIVSDDLSVPKALQAGANSILRKPLLVNQVKDTLTTARDLLRAKQESASNAQAAAAGISATGVAGAGTAAVPMSALPANPAQGHEKNLRAGEFLQSAPSAPGGQFVTDSEVNEFRVSSSMEKDLEPVAASVDEEEKPAPPPPETGEVRGLEWYLKTRAGIVPQVPGNVAAQASTLAAAHASAHASTPAAPPKPELLGYDQTPSFSATPAANSASSRFAAATPENSEGSLASEAHSNPSAIPVKSNDQNHEQKKEAELFAYITRGSGESVESESSPRPRFRFKGAIVGALALAACAIAAAPQAPWHTSIQTAWARGRLNLHAWLNPQPVTTPQAPIAHEDFARAGDEYKLPATETIPDATTDASQIQVVPAVEPTAPKPNIMGGNVMPPGTVEAGSATPSDPTAASGVPVAGNRPQLTPVAAQLPSGSGTSGTSGALGSPALASPASSNQGSTSPASSVSTSPVSTPPSGPAPTVPAALPTHSDPPTVFPSASSATSGPGQPAPQKTQPQSAAPSVPTNVPSSLKSQMASTTPEASGNRSAESAMQSIEPVKVDEASERALLTDQPAPDYPASSSGQPGMVVLQVLIGRDGTVQDAKFLQGALGFARAAIDGVKRWKFKPYTMNGRPVSVQTSLTISFKPAS